MVSNQPEKKKTKAKQRYLKVKRERRKKRKAAAVEAIHESNVKNKIKVLGDSGTLRDARTRSSEEERAPDSKEEISDVESSDAGESENPTSITAVQCLSEHSATTSHAEVKRPRKRRKLEKEAQNATENPVLDAASTASRGSSPNEETPLVDDFLLGPHATDLVPLAAFPMPSAPVAASQKVLALQGLDPRLIDAEIVDSTRTMPIDSPDTDGISSFGLASKTRKRLKELGITELFAVQSALIPFLLPASPYQRALYRPYNPPQDVCVSAPTGSGKTLAYVLPILELLSTRIVTRLRALVVLPTRDLVTQVRETFEALCRGRGLKIATATGQHSFVHEQAQLVEKPSINLQGGSSKVDILICTPGRLIDHLNGTVNFSLQHLRFLVIDEADRLLTQSFQDWLAQVLAATRPPSSLPPTSPPLDAVTDTNTSDTLPRHDAVSPAWLPFPPSRSHIDETRESSCQKLLFSATLTRDPSKISALGLRDAKYFVVKDTPHDEQGDHVVAGETFVFPATLNEHMVVCSTYQKPLILFYLVHKHGIIDALVFTKSTESTNSLVKLFECFENAKGSSSARPIVHAYSSDLGSAERKSILEKFKSREINILVCSDLISRGIDISHVSHVVSYDAPVDMRKYVHRVGRTARAGRTGDAWSLIEEQEARYFKRMLSEANHLSKVRKLKVLEDDLKDFKEYYESAMKVYSSHPREE